MPLQLSALRLSEDPVHPVRTFLSHLYVGCWNDVEASIFEMSKLVETCQTEDPGVAAEIARLIAHVNERLQVMVESGPWLFGDRQPLTPVKALRFAQVLSDEPELAVEMFARLQKRKVGSPPTKYVTYLVIFELMLQSNAMSLGRARQKLKPPLPRENEPSLKAGIRNLKTLLRKHAPDFVARYESLHPDKAKKVNG